MDKEIELLILKAMDERNFVKLRRNGVLLSDNHISLFKRYNIDWEDCGSLGSLLFRIDQLLEECGDDEELDRLYKELYEQYYYRYCRR